jgi:beta-lactamase class A
MLGPTLLVLSAVSLPSAPAVLGVAAIDLDRGTPIVMLRESERFPMGSVYKLPIAMAALRRVDEGALALSQTVNIDPAEFAPGYSPIRDAARGRAVSLTLGRLIDAALSDSDNTAADALQRVEGGPPAVNAYLHEIGVSGIRVDRTEQQIGRDIQDMGVAAYNRDERDTATPQGMVDLLVAIHSRRDRLSAASHELLIKTLVTSRNPRHLSLGLPPDAVLAHKSGNMPGVMNDVGLVSSPDGRHHLAIAVFTKQAETSESAPRDQVIAEVARRVYQAVFAP